MEQTVQSQTWMELYCPVVFVFLGCAVVACMPPGIFGTFDNSLFAYSARGLSGNFAALEKLVSPTCSLAPLVGALASAFQLPFRCRREAHG